MATALVDFEHAFIPGPLIEELPAPLAIVEAEPEGENEKPIRLHTVRASLGDSILLSAVQDYMGANERNHNSAALFLYPGDEHYRRHFQWVVGMTNFPAAYVRVTLDRLRPRWDAERQPRKER
jgi:hypothetical protein